MKKIVSIFLFLIPAIAYLQPSKDPAAPYFKNNGFPDIQLLLTDSTTIYTKENLPKDKTVVLIFFSPDCEHCQHTAKEMTKKMDSLSNLFMVWNGPSYLPLEQVKEFYTNYHLANYTNIIMGKEVNYFMPLHYRIEITPYAAIYKNGKLFAEFRTGLELQDLIALANDTYVVPTVVTTPASIDIKKEKWKREKKKGKE
jgi:thiol-disulfide isomerase/thioredoxin